MTEQSRIPQGKLDEDEVPSGQRARAIWAIQHIGALPLSWDWMNEAACRYEKGDHFSENPRSPEYIRALKQCGTCSAVGKCAVLRALLARKGNPVPGIWGGIEPHVWQGAKSAATQLKNIGKKAY